jgi:uncharacterized membrane protein YqaE (UPF0057 family)
MSAEQITAFLPVLGVWLSAGLVTGWVAGFFGARRPG